jgi:hypothetical protein
MSTPEPSVPVSTAPIPAAGVTEEVQPVQPTPPVEPETKQQGWSIILTAREILEDNTLGPSRYTVGFRGYPTEEATKQGIQALGEDWAKRRTAELEKENESTKTE